MGCDKIKTFKRYLGYAFRLFLLGAYPAVVGVMYLNNTPIHCLYRQSTGNRCPGCGVTTMVLHLLHLEIYEAFQANMFMFITAPVILYFMFTFVRLKKEPPLWMIVSYTGAIILWMLFRNYYNI